VGYLFLSGLTPIAEKLDKGRELRLLIGDATNRETLEQLAVGYQRLELVAQAAEAQAYPKRTETERMTDILDIWSYIAEDTEHAADRVEGPIYEACAFLAEAPLRGHSRPDLTTRFVRFWTLTRYPGYTVYNARRRLPFRLSLFCTGKGKGTYGAS
jgi:plasmid stabilization system protein ParE